MLANHPDDAANVASWALLALKNSSVKVPPANVEPVSVVTGLPSGIYSTNSVPENYAGFYSASQDGDMRDSNENNQQELALFHVNGDKYVMRKELVQIGRNSSKGSVDIDVTRTDSTATGFVSRVHCEVRFSARNQRFYLSCFGKNGVFVDDSFQKHGDSPLQLRSSCVLTFPSTQISVRFTSLIRDSGETPVAIGNSNGYHVSDTRRADDHTEQKSRNGLKLLNGELSSPAQQAACALANVGRGVYSAALLGDACELALHIPAGETKPERCDNDRTAVQRADHNLARFCVAANGADGTCSPVVDTQCGSNTNSCPVSPKQPPASNGCTLSQSLPGAIKHDVEQPTPTFRQPANGSCAKPNGHSNTIDAARAAFGRLPHHDVPLATNDGDGDDELDAETGSSISTSKGRGAKPPYSYAQLIAQAIASTPQRQLTLSGIYAFITKNYPYFMANDKGWQNSIRHNLSLNRFFMKVPRSHEEPGKGMFWRIEAEYEEKLIATAYRKRRQRPTQTTCASDGASVSNASRKPTKSRTSNTRSNPDCTRSGPTTNCSAPTSPGTAKSPPPFTNATLTATASASSCSSRSTSPATENELIGMVQQFVAAAGSGVSPAASKSVSLPHSPVTTFFIDKVKHRSGDGRAESESLARLSYASLLPLGQTASARSTPAFPITMKQSPLTLPAVTAHSPTVAGDQQPQQFAVLVQTNANRQYSQLIGRAPQQTLPPPDALTPPNSASSSSQSRGLLSAPEWMGARGDQFTYPNAKASLCPVELPATAACCARPTVVMNSQLQSYLQQQSGSMAPTNALFIRQYSVPTSNTEPPNSDAPDHGAATRKRLSDSANVSDEPVAGDHSLSAAIRANGHAVPLKKRCYVSPEISQNGQH